MHKFCIPAVMMALGMLAACGGGGDAAPPLASGSVTGTSCTVLDDASTCSSVITWTTANAVTPRVTVNGATASTLANGTVTTGIPIGTTTVSVTDGTTVLATTTVNAACGATSVVSGGVCKPTILRYTDKVYKIWTAAYPFMDDGNGHGKIQLINKTSFPGLRPFMKCWYLDDNLPNGEVVFNCQHVTQFDRHILYTNPTEETPSLYEFKGTLPANPQWKAVQEFDSSKPGFGVYARVSNGVHLLDGDKPWITWFQPDSGEAFKTYEGVPAVDETVNAILSYSN